MKRAVEIINSLRAGMETMLGKENAKRVNCLRMFNFEKNRVSLRMEMMDDEHVSHPMGLIDVIEYSTGENSKPSCNCHMTELATGKTEKLRLKSANKVEQNLECLKVFSFFRKVLDLPAVSPDENVFKDEPINLPAESKKVSEDSNMFPPVGGKLPKNPRGAQ